MEASRAAAAAATVDGGGRGGMIDVEYMV